MVFKILQISILKYHYEIQWKFTKRHFTNEFCVRSQWIVATKYGTWVIVLEFRIDQAYLKLAPTTGNWADEPYSCMSNGPECFGASKTSNSIHSFLPRTYFWPFDQCAIHVFVCARLCGRRRRACRPNQLYCFVCHLIASVGQVC